MINNIAIIGAGAWGMALAFHLSKKSRNISIFTRDISKCKNAKQADKLYSYYLKIQNLENVDFVGFDEHNHSRYDYMLFVLPASAIESFCVEHAELLAQTDNIVICSKAILSSGNFLITDISKYFSRDIYILSGPNFAHEVIDEKFTISTIAHVDYSKAEHLSAILSGQYMLFEPSDDVDTVQIFGACKNIIAIACGFLNHHMPSCNMQAALITLVVQELSILIDEMGGNISSLYLSAAIGDIYLTCTSVNSRNYQFGEKIAQNKHVEFLEANIVEGYNSLPGLLKLASNKNVILPIFQAIYEICHTKMSADEKHQLLVKKLLGNKHECR
jgi:glycerol-3-phosphate dehydrogenase (NAD(P)+)